MKEEQNKIIYIEDNEEMGFVEYIPKDNNTVDIIHTYVDPKYRGKKIASKLLNYLFERLKQEDKKAICSCSYAKDWVKNNEEYKNQVK